MQNTNQVHASEAHHDGQFEESYRRYSDVMITSLLESKEKSRRLADKDGELNRKLTSAKVSKLIEASATDASVVTGNLQTLYERGTGIAQSLVEAGTSASHKAYDVAVQGVDAASRLGHQVMDIAHDGAAAAESALKSSGISSLVGGAINKVNHFVDDLADSIQLFAIKELEEAERARRIGSSNGAQAVLNARATSALIRGIGAPFYSPTFEPNLNYGTRLLEEMERDRRMWEDINGKVAIVNAHELAEVVKDSVRLLKISGHLNIPTEETKLEERPTVPMATRLTQ